GFQKRILRLLQLPLFGAQPAGWSAKPTICLEFSSRITPIFAVFICRRTLTTFRCAKNSPCWVFPALLIFRAQPLTLNNSFYGYEAPKRPSRFKIFQRTSARTISGSRG